MVQTPPATESFARLRQNRERKRQLTKLRLSRAGQAGYAWQPGRFLGGHESRKVPSAALLASGSGRGAVTDATGERWARFVRIRYETSRFFSAKI